MEALQTPWFARSVIALKDAADDNHPDSTATHRCFERTGLPCPILSASPCCPLTTPSRAGRTGRFWPPTASTSTTSRRGQTWSRGWPASWPARRSTRARGRLPRSGPGPGCAEGFDRLIQCSSFRHDNLVLHVPDLGADGPLALCVQDFFFHCSNTATADPPPTCARVETTMYTPPRLKSKVNKLAFRARCASSCRRVSGEREAVRVSVDGTPGSVDARADLLGVRPF